MATGPDRKRRRAGMAPPRRAPPPPRPMTASRPTAPPLPAAGLPSEAAPPAKAAPPLEAAPSSTTGLPSEAAPPTKEAPPLEAAPPPTTGLPSEAAPPSESSSYTPVVQLNPADCTIDFLIEENGLKGHGLAERGLSRCWSAARATVGIVSGKYCFGCEILPTQEQQDVGLAGIPADQLHVCRIGISRECDPVEDLGEVMEEYGFGPTNKSSSSKAFFCYDVSYEVGDTFVCYLDLDKLPLASVRFSRNGQWLADAVVFHAGSLGVGEAGSALFPHVLLKNVEVKLQFCSKDGLAPLDGCKHWASAIEDQKFICGPSFSKSNECEVVMMIGLPASGKSAEAKNMVKKYPEKRFIVLGTDLALKLMKVHEFKENTSEDFGVMMDCALGIFNLLLARASQIQRNFILDQSNICKSVRIQKLKPFIKHRKKAVVMFPKLDGLISPATKRLEKLGWEEPARKLEEMIAMFDLPMRNGTASVENLDEVIFCIQNSEEAQKDLENKKHILQNSIKKHSAWAQTKPENKQNFHISNNKKKSKVKKLEKRNLKRKFSHSGEGPSTHELANPASALPQNFDSQIPVQAERAYSRADCFEDPRSMTNYINRHHSEYGRRDEPDPSGNYSVPVPVNKGRTYEAFDPYQHPRAYSFEHHVPRYTGRQNELDHSGNYNVPIPLIECRPYEASDPYWYARAYSSEHHVPRYTGYDSRRLSQIAYQIPLSFSSYNNPSATVETCAEVREDTRERRDRYNIVHGFSSNPAPATNYPGSGVREASVDEGYRIPDPVDRRYSSWR